MDAGELKILEAELSAQLREINAVYGRIEERAHIAGPSGAESLAYQLHNLYSAFEELFEIVARTFENHLVGERGYHIELLRRMNVEVKGVRPALVPDELVPLLDSLRTFRHFFRHAYSQEIDHRKLLPLLDDARRLQQSHEEMVHSFLARIA